MKTIAVIGHQGRMGAMLARHWAAAGHTVRGADRPASTCSAHADCAPPGEERNRNVISPQELELAATGADVIVLCVPAPNIPAVLADLPLAPSQLLMDITSVKILPMRQMQERHTGPVVGSHPLFGPAPKSEDMAVALTPGEKAEPAHVALAASLFTVFGCRVFETTPESHDRGAAFVQGLNFVSSAAYFASLANREDVLPFLTPSFRRRLESARKLLTEDAGMFEAFTTANPMTKDAIHTFRLFLDLVESGGLHHVVKQARTWF